MLPICYNQTHSDPPVCCMDCLEMVEEVTYSCALSAFQCLCVAPVVFLYLIVTFIACYGHRQTVIY